VSNNSIGVEYIKFYENKYKSKGLTPCYDENPTRNPYSRYYWKRMTENIFKFGSIRENPQIKVLDIGCDYGFFVLELARHVSYSIGTDINKHQLEVLQNSAKNKALQNVICLVCDAMNLPFKTKSFDVVICSHVLEHLPNDRKCMYEINRILKYDGVLIIAVPLEDNFYFKLYRKIRSIPDTQPTLQDILSGKTENEHLRKYTVKSLINLIKDADFIPLELDLFECSFPFNREIAKHFPSLFKLLIFVGKKCGNLSESMMIKAVKRTK